MSQNKSENKQNLKTRARSIAAGLTIFTVLVALLLALVPLQPAAIVSAQQDWKLQAARAEKLQPANAVKRKGEILKPSAAMAATKGAKRDGVATAKTNQTAGTPTAYYVLNVEFTDAAARAAFKVPGVTVLTGFDRFADVFAATDAAYDAVVANPKVVAAELASIATAPPPPPGQASLGGRPGDLPAKIVRGGFNGLTGKGVTIAIIDTGVDFRHPDFITYDAAGKPMSRIAALWDTTLEYKTGRGTAADYKYPNGASIGTVFTKDQLTAELNRATRTIPATDLNGHGTACAGISAGNGNADNRRAGGLKRPSVVGVAPDADIIAVRIDQGEDFDGLENSYLLNAASIWMDKLVGAKPLVVSCSFGGQRGAHDGTRVAERELDALYPLTKKSRAIVFSAGNDGDTRMHSGDVYHDKTKPYLMGWKTEGQAELRLYFDTIDTDLYIAPATADTKYDKPVWSQNPISKQWQAVVQIPAGIGGVFIYNDSNKQTRVDGYIYGGDFLAAYATYDRLIGSPGTATNVITVGSYDWNDVFNQGGKEVSLATVCSGAAMTINDISCYSSPGPRRDNVTKPEIVSPGQWYAAADAKNAEGQTVGWGVGMTDTTGYYRQMNGTSSAAPYTAGVVALMFQKKPTLTLGEIKTALTKNASQDPFSATGTNIKEKWGFGRLNYEAVARIMNSL